MVIDEASGFISLLRARHVTPESIEVVLHFCGAGGGRSRELAELFSNANVISVKCAPNELDPGLVDNICHERVASVKGVIGDSVGCSQVCSGDQEVTVQEISCEPIVANIASCASNESAAIICDPCLADEGLLTIECLCRGLGVSRVDVIWMDFCNNNLVALRSVGDMIYRVGFVDIDLCLCQECGGCERFYQTDLYLREKGFRLCSVFDRRLVKQSLIYENRRNLHYARCLARRIDAEPDQPIVIHQSWGGLGDNLQFSTLPERFSEFGIQVLISATNVVRNQEIHDLVWGCNPYILGVSDRVPSAGEVRVGVMSKFPPRDSFIERIEKAHGLEPRNRLPKIYYTPKIIPSMSNMIFIDLGSTSIVPEREKLQIYIGYIFQRFHYPLEDCRIVGFRNRVAGSPVMIDGVELISVDNIFEYCDILNSCKAFVTVHSGAMSLAAAIRGERSEPFIHSYATTTQYNWRNYIYHNVDYFVL